MIKLKAVSQNLKNNVKFLIQDENYSNPYLVQKIFIYKDKDIVEVNNFFSDKKVEELHLGYNSPSVAFIHNSPKTYELQRRRKIKLDGEIFYISLGLASTYRKYLTKTRNSFTNSTANLCHLYLPENIFKLKKTKERIIKSNTYHLVKEEYLSYYRDPKNDISYKFSFLCNERIAHLENNKKFVNKAIKIRDAVQDTVKSNSLTQKSKDALLNELKTFVSEYKNFQVQT